MRDDRLYLGLDLGSGARVVVVDARGRVVARGKAALADFSANPRRPAVWLAAADDGAVALTPLGSAASMRPLATTQPPLQ